MIEILIWPNMDPMTLVVVGTMEVWEAIAIVIVKAFQGCL